jgi:hypothetical protein
MKTILKIGAAALALSLMTGASAFAQNAAPANAAPDTTAPAAQSGMSGSPAMESQSGQPMSGQGGAATPDTMNQGATAQGSGQGGMSANTAETANTPAGAPPATYPACKHKGEDRCMQEASISGSHRVKHHVVKSKKSTAGASDMSGAAAPATPPAQ